MLMRLLTLRSGAESLSAVAAADTGIQGPLLPLLHAGHWCCLETWLPDAVLLDW
jgi:hypothetical protein